MAKELDIAEVLEENRRRRADLQEHYNPYTGEGSLVPRTAVPWLGSVVYLPDTMLELDLVKAVRKAGGVKEAAEAMGLPVEMLSSMVIEARLDHDFEFWAAVCAKIKDKRTGELVPLHLNRPQRKYIAKVLELLVRNGQVRLNVLKHRQWGCTTCTQALLAWMQIRVRKNWDAYVCGLDEAQANEARAMYETLGEQYPVAFGGPILLVPYRRSTTSRWIPSRGSYVAIGSVQSPLTFSGRTLKLVHMSEVGKYPSNPRINAEDLMQNTESMTPDAPGTLWIRESTAKANIGTYWKRECQRSAAGKESNFDFFFVSWLDEANLERKLPADVAGWVATWSDYERFLWESGATLEQIAWYIHKRRGYDDPAEMMEEYPTTWEEAFQTGKRRAFPALYVQTTRKTVEQPLARGTLYAAAEKGPDAFRELHFEHNPKGPLSIWSWPDATHDILDPRKLYTNRFCGAGDIGGVWEKADFSDLLILDRALRWFCGPDRVAAEWHGHLDHDLFAWEAARLAYWYQKALLAVEVNSLIEDRGDPVQGLEPMHGLTILDEIMEHYPNLYRRTIMDKVAHQLTLKAGFHMNAQTKPIVVSHYRGVMRERSYVEKCEAACEEADTYIIDEKGRYRADDGHKDDRVVTRMIATWLSDQMDPVVEVDPEQKRKKRPVTAAEF